jgi:hypothetical protein
MLTGGKVGLVDLLQTTGERLPDLAPKADAWLEELGKAVTPENIAGLVKELPAEVANILRMALDPRDHSSDAI